MDFMYYVIIGAVVGGIIGLIISIPLMKKQKRINKGQDVAQGGIGTGSRFEQTVLFKGNKEELEIKIKEFLAQKKFNIQEYGSEKVYRKGDGVWVAGQFIKYYFVPNGVKIEAFVILFGTKESNLEGFTGIAAKKPLKKVVNELISLIK